MDVIEKIKFDDVYDHGINFLIGSGASLGLLPTLSVGIKDEFGDSETIETLATRFKRSGNENHLSLLFMYYYLNCIVPATKLNIGTVNEDLQKKSVLENYKRLMDTLLVILQRKKSDIKLCSVFTTNYDGCLYLSADELFKEGNTDFILNDGARGFTRRYLHVKNFNSIVSQTGVFDRHRSDIPQINIINLHGSIYWRSEDQSIRVENSPFNAAEIIDECLLDSIREFSEIILDESKYISDIPEFDLSEESVNKFWSSYNKLPIVNPTKWKFHETVFEEHYYQMLRHLSYELEKTNAVFITFGFSFSDEHILNIVRRSLSNPTLQVFVCCFNADELAAMKFKFRTYKNVQYVSLGSDLNFTRFNKHVFTLINEEEVDDPLIEEVIDPVEIL